MLFHKVETEPVGAERACFGFSMASGALVAYHVIMALRPFGAKTQCRFFEGLHGENDKIYGLLVYWGNDDLYSIVDSQRWAEDEAEKYFQQVNPVGE
jgi:hypothetical protein